MSRKIKTQPTLWTEGFNMWGWLCGKETYIAFGIENKGLGELSGYKLYRLAKAIVNEFEKSEDKAVVTDGKSQIVNRRS
jgi:hypothetical protein